MCWCTRVSEEATTKAAIEGKSTDEAAIEGAIAVAAVIEANREVFSVSDTSESSLSGVDGKESISQSVDASSNSEKQLDEESSYLHLEGLEVVACCGIIENGPNQNIHEIFCSAEVKPLVRAIIVESDHESLHYSDGMHGSFSRGGEDTEGRGLLLEGSSFEENGQCFSSRYHDSASESYRQLSSDINEECSTPASVKLNCIENRSQCPEELSSAPVLASAIINPEKPIRIPRKSTVRDINEECSTPASVKLNCIKNRSQCPEELSSAPVLASAIINPEKPIRIPRKSTVRDYHDYFQHYSFAERFPSFFHIFTAFHISEKTNPTGQTPKKRTCNNATMEFISCVKIQIQLQTKVFQIAEEVALTGWDDCNEARESYIAQTKDFATHLFFRVQSSRPEVASIIYDAADALNEKEPHWFELPADVGLGTCWNLLWSWSRPKIDHSSLLTFQKVNHFQNAQTLTRKDYLKKCIERYCSEVGGLGLSYNLQRDAHGYAREVDKQSLLGSSFFNIMPQTFILPKEYTTFVAAFFASQREDSMSNFWIMKPIRSSRGRGISLVNDICSVNYSEPVVLQKYLMNPLLLYGFKFDLRLYLLVTSFNPLEAFVYREGFGRFGSKKYSGSPLDINDERIHLTNSSVQSKYNMSNEHPARLAGKEGGGNKVTLTWLWKTLSDLGYDSRKMKRDIDELCLKTLLCAECDIPHQVSSMTH